MVTFQEEQRTFIRNLLSSGVTSAEANVASADFKKVSINYGRVTEALKLAENALKRARELYDIEIRDAAVEAIVNSSLSEIDWSDVKEPLSPDQPKHDHGQK